MDRCIATDRRANGFTLLEVTLALALGLVLVTTIFSVATSTVQMTAEISSFQTEATRKQAFIQLCRKTLMQMDGNASISLLPAGDESQLVIDNDPGAFSFGPVSRGSSRVVLFSRKKSVRLKYLNEIEVERMSEGEWQDIGVELELLTNVTQLKWAFFDPQSRQWVNEWQADQGRPSLVELKFQTDSSDTRTVFWIPRFDAPSPAPDPPEETTPIEEPEPQETQ